MVVCFARELKAQFAQTNSCPPPHTSVTLSVYSCNFVGYCRSFSNCIVLCFLCVLCPGVLYFQCIHHFLCMSYHTLHTCMTFLSALWWPNVSL